MIGFFTTYLEQLHDAAPRQTDCPGRFRSAQPVRTHLPIDWYSLGVHLCTVLATAGAAIASKFFPNYRIGRISPKVFSWNLLTSIV